MSCDKYKNMVPEYISDELEESEKYDIEKHISECADCRNALETERIILSMTAEDIYEIPEDLNETVLSKLKSKKSIFHLKYMRYAVAASFFFLAVLSYFIFQTSEVTNAVDPAKSYVYSNSYVIGSDYDELISYNTELYDENKWTSDNVDIFQSESDLIHDILTLEELESYDIYLSSL